MKIIKFLKFAVILSIAFPFTGLTQASAANCDTFPDLFRMTTRDGFSICRREKFNTSLNIECFTFFPETEASANQTINKLLSNFRDKLDTSCQTNCYIYGARAKHVDCKMRQLF